MEITRITVDELKERMDRGEELIILDSRNPQAWAESQVKIPGAIRLVEDQLPQEAEKLQRNHSIIVYCT
jgi:adenylyltransferase/sulfurtransferase